VMVKVGVVRVSVMVIERHSVTKTAPGNERR
jgi:hypothetical protein